MKKMILLAALASAFSTVPASAQGQADRQAVVRYADLDLSRPADVRALDRRIRVAAEAVCGAGSDIDPAGKNAIRRCREQTVQRAAGFRDRLVATTRGSAVQFAIR
jgi:UrcA family protein